ncbi:Uncharacterised protein [Vibrio cholerae]|nr:Uncharacterised protein [Vibrio cholerae]
MFSSFFHSFSRNGPNLFFPINFIPTCTRCFRWARHGV